MTTSATCSRSWQAEAAEDRRLSDADRASFERHLTTCPVCTSIVHDLVELRRIGERTEAPASAPLEHRRTRNELLRRANDLTLATPRATRWRGLAVAAAVAILGVVAVVVLRPGAPGSSPSVAPNEPSYELVASPGAEWAPVQRGPTLKLATRRGRFELTVRHLAEGQRFLLVLPDGELEVQGTRFVVEVDGARTLGVRVVEGRVALRVRERAGSLLLLGAGESFAASVPFTPPAASTTPPAAGASSPTPTPGEPASPAMTPAAGSGTPPASSAERGATTDGARGVEFASAMNAFSSGNFGQAEKLFQAFAARHPTDPRAEDATFLSAVASARRGDHESARILANRYLARYPNGLRRREAERLAE